MYITFRFLIMVVDTDSTISKQGATVNKVLRLTKWTGYSSCHSTYIGSSWYSATRFPVYISVNSIDPPCILTPYQENADDCTIPSMVAHLMTTEVRLPDEINRLTMEHISITGRASSRASCDPKKAEVLDLDHLSRRGRWSHDNWRSSSGRNQSIQDGFRFWYIE